MDLAICKTMLFNSTNNELKSTLLDVSYNKKGPFVNIVTTRVCPPVGPMLSPIANVNINKIPQ